LYAVILQSLVAYKTVNLSQIYAILQRDRDFVTPALYTCTALFITVIITEIMLETHKINIFEYWYIISAKNVQFSYTRNIVESVV